MKRYEFDIDEFYLNRFFPKERVKSKAQVIEILMESINYMLLNPNLEKDKVKGKIILQIDKMSRIFFFNDNKQKYFSIVFPFYIDKVDNKYNFLFQNFIEVDNRLTSQVISIIKCDEFKANCSLDFFDIRCEYEDECDEDFWIFLTELLLIEDGYIRYDYDEENYKKFKNLGEEHKHPLNHYDLFYSSNATFKIGLKESLSEDDFIDLLNINTDCKYLGEN